MTGPTNLLLTSAGRRVELLRSFAAAYVGLEDSGHLVVVDANPLAPALQALSAPHLAYIVPRGDTPNFVERLVEICFQQQVGAVLPLIDPDIERLAKIASDLQHAGTRVLGVGPEAAAIASDKWRTYELFRSLGLAVPRTWLASEIRIEEVPMPCFLKPRFGSASQNTYRINDRRHLATFVDYVPDALIQDLLEGPEITTDLLTDYGGSVVAVVSRQRIEVRAGEVAKGRTIHDENIARACVAIADALPARGPITVQCMMHRGRPHFTEINARLGGGVPLAIAAGVNIPEILMKIVRGDRLQPLSWDFCRKDVYMSRFDDSFFLDESFHRI